MPIDIHKPEVIKFLIESYEKTARLRMKWNTLNKSKLLQTAILTNEKGHTEQDIIKETMVEGMPSITRAHISGFNNRRQKPKRDGIHVPTTVDMKKGHSIVDIGIGDPAQDPRLARPDSDLTLDPVMRPVDPEEREIVYKPRPYFGREVYLKTRSKISPEDKYYLQECNQWGYGWRLKDTPLGRHRPAHGRVWRLTRDMMSRSGPRPDPSHYRSANREVQKCGL